LACVRGRLLDDWLPFLVPLPRLSSALRFLLQGEPFFPLRKTEAAFKSTGKLIDFNGEIILASMSMRAPEHQRRLRPNQSVNESNETGNYTYEMADVNTSAAAPQTPR